MAYDVLLADRIREALANEKEVEEKQMFGGVCFMVNGKMCVGVIKDDMMCRIGPEAEPDALERHGCRPMDFTSRPMKGYVYVSGEGLARQRDLAYWIQLCLAFNITAKASKPKRNKGK